MPPIRGIEPEDIKVKHFGGPINTPAPKDESGPNYFDMDYDKFEAHVFGAPKPNRYEKTE